MICLIREAPNPTVGSVGLVAQDWILERVEGLEGFARQVAFLEDILESVALEADRQRLVFVPIYEALDTHVTVRRDDARAREIDVTLSWPMTRFAVDLKGRVLGCISGAWIELGQDLTAVALLAVREPIDGADWAHRWPVATVGEAHVRGDGFPALIGS